MISRVRKPFGLVIDGDARARQHISAELKRLGLTVEETESTEPGLLYCEERHPDFVFVSMGENEQGIGGFLQRLRLRPKRLQPKVIAYAPRAEAETVGRIILHGAAEFLSGPIDGDVLGFKLRQLGVL